MYGEEGTSMFIQIFHFGSTTGEALGTYLGHIWDIFVTKCEQVQLKVSESNISCSSTLVP